MNMNTNIRKMTSHLSFDPSPLSLPHDTIIIGRKETFSSSSLDTILQLLPLPIMEEEQDKNQGGPSSNQHSLHVAPILDAMIQSIGKSGKATTFLPSSSSSSSSSVSKLTLVILPDKVSRNNHPMSPHTITESLQGIMLEKSEMVQIHVLDRDVEKNMGAVAVAIARALPMYSSKSTSSTKSSKSSSEDEETIKEQNVSVSFHGKEGEVVEKEDLWDSVRAVADGVRLACRLGDMPPAELTPQKYAEECRKIAQELEGVEFEEIVGEELRERGYGGVFGVGMGAKDAPRLVVMKYTPKDVELDEGGVEVENIVLCGKGVVYDTGGLSLKPKTGMCGMKHGKLVLSIFDVHLSFLSLFQ
jgi:probable aminopeptidase NPEPL1